MRVNTQSHRNVGVAAQIWHVQKRALNRPTARRIPFVAIASTVAITASAMSFSGTQLATSRLLARNFSVFSAGILTLSPVAKFETSFSLYRFARGDQRRVKTMHPFFLTSAMANEESAWETPVSSRC